MDELMAFHFLRPWFLLLIPLLILFSLWLRLQGRQQTGFEQWIDAHLLPYISTNDQQGKHSGFYSLLHSLPYFLLALAWLLTSVALAGPTWKQLPQALHQSEQAMVILLDLSPSMRAEDNKPSRIVRARLKIKDLLTQRKDGLTALVVYAGEAHIVTPLTDDTRTIINLLSTLEPGLLPIPGSNIEMATEVSMQLIKESGLTRASLVLITDGVDKAAIKSVSNTLANNIDVFILGVGTPDGAPIPIADSTGNHGFMQDKNNNVITAIRDDQELQNLAQTINGYYLPLQADDSDIRFIIDSVERPISMATEQAKQVERSMDKWAEFGPTLLLLLLPFLAFMFRRGWILLIVVTLTPAFMPEPAFALSWDALWLNKNQQAEKAFKENDYSRAQQQFSDSQWQGSAAYKNKNYQAALDAFSKGERAVDFYNKGNALAQLGNIDEAIKAYDTALVKDPSLDDAKKNKQLLEKIKKQQEQQEEQRQNNSDKQDQNNKDQNEQQQDKQQQSSDDKNDEKNQQQQQDSSQENAKQNNDKQDNDKQNAEENNGSNDNNKEEEKDNKTEQATEDKNKEDNDKEPQALAHLSKEEKQELEQWIRKIPDDPSGLLRRKFEYEFQKRRQLYQSGQWNLPDNNAHQRY
jgi:Ca-activated chloride channel homolog